MLEIWVYTYEIYFFIYILISLLYFTRLVKEKPRSPNKKLEIYIFFVGRLFFIFFFLFFITICPVSLTQQNGKKFLLCLCLFSPKKSEASNLILFIVIFLSEQKLVYTFIYYPTSHVFFIVFLYISFSFPPLLRKKYASRALFLLCTDGYFGTVSLTWQNIKNIPSLPFCLLTKIK